MRNLAYICKEEDLEELFKKFGELILKPFISFYTLPILEISHNSTIDLL